MGIRTDKNGRRTGGMKRYSEKAMRFVFMASAAVSVVAVAMICIFLLYKGFPAIAEIGVFEFLGGTVWKPLEGEFGIFPMILGSVYVTAGAALLGVPVGIFCAVFLVKFCPKMLYKVLRPAVDLLAGIPSIVYGFFGLMVIVPVMQDIFGGSGKGILTASVLLAIMILPTIISVAESSLKAVPESCYEGAVALGATRERGVFFTVLPAAKQGILAGVILGIGRAAGETMAVVYIAGNQAVVPDSVVSGVRTLTANIVLEMGYAADGIHRNSLIATAVVLFVFVLIINLSFSVLKRRDF